MYYQNKNSIVVSAFFILSIIMPGSSGVLVADSEEHYAHKHLHIARPDGYAPIGVRGEHTHDKGDWMFSYRLMYMSMEGNRNKANNLSTDEVLADYMVAPTDMDVWMHMFGLMYAPTDSLTLMSMIPYISKSMNHTTRTGVNFNTKSEGIGDIKLMALYKLFDRSDQRIHLNAGISFPTGSIDEDDDLPSGKNQTLPYPMQLGSGTFDLIPGITYLGQYGNWSWGAQALGTIRLGKNDEDYALGDVLNTTLWGARNLNNWLSTATRLDWKMWGNIDGADPRLNPNVVPTADPNNMGGNRLDLLFSLNFLIPRGPELVKGQRFAVEAGLPIYQWLDGPQLKTEWIITFGWQYAWKFR